jgi:release factor glutamine methyltransferase
MILNQDFLELNEKYGEREAKNLVKIILEDCFQKKSLSDLDQVEIYKLKDLLHRLLNNEPVQSITQNAYFYGLPFYVNESVLIPRPETEELTEIAIQLINHSHRSVLDIGTGSGCIAITISKNCPESKVDACDISSEALAIAIKNNDFHKTNVHFFEHDILKFQKEESPKTYDLILSNPPYIPDSEKTLMSENVINFEPHLALFVPNDNPFIFYKAIFNYCNNHLKKNGHLLLECNEFNIEKLNELGMSTGLFLSSKIIKDLSGKKRMIHFIKS